MEDFIVIYEYNFFRLTLQLIDRVILKPVEININGIISRIAIYFSTNLYYDDDEN